MSTSDNSPAIGLDIGSSYVKSVSLEGNNTVTEKYLQKTGYHSLSAVATLLERFKCTSSILGVTGYGRALWSGTVRRTEISALVKGMEYLGIRDGILVDIGGQDCKLLKLKDGKLVGHVLNRRCAAGTGSYLEFFLYRLEMEAGRMNELAGQADRIHRLNNFCTVFTATEVLDCINRGIPLPRVIRGMYASIVERIREMGSLEPPVFLSGGVVTHHPVLTEIFDELLKIKTQVVAEPQFLAAIGIAVYAREKSNERNL